MVPSEGLPGAAALDVGDVPPDELAASFDRYNAFVRRTVPAARLLEINYVREIRFLNASSPDRARWEKLNGDLIREFIQ